MKNDMVRRLVVGVMVFNATFNNISAISWRSVLLVEETRENLPHVTDKLYLIIMYRVHFPMSQAGFELTILMLIDTDCKANYHTTTIPKCSKCYCATICWKRSSENRYKAKLSNHVNHLTFFVHGPILMSNV